MAGQPEAQLGIPAAKNALRSLGQGRLASRLGRASKARNWQAHADVGLPMAILAAGRKFFGNVAIQVETGQLGGDDSDVNSFSSP